MGLKHKWIILVMCLGLLVACRGKASPGLSPLASPLASPLYSPVSSPVPALAEVPVFSIQQPLNQGQTEITGTGPAGVPIRVVDVTHMGDELGAGVIDREGRFSIAVVPLPSGHRVGIMLGEVSDPGRRQALQRGGQDIPMIGIVLTSTIVEE